MKKSINKRGLFLLSLFVVSFIFQILSVFSSAYEKQFNNQNHSSDYVPYKNKTDYNLLTSFIEEETEDENDSELSAVVLNLLLSQSLFNFYENNIHINFNSKIAYKKDTPLFINILSLRI